MEWTCEACNFEMNSNSTEKCLACYTPRLSPQDGNRLEDFELEEGKSLRVKLKASSTPIEHGIPIDKLDNPSLNGVVDVGDLVVAIQGEPVKGKLFTEVVNTIRTLPRPLKITFEIVENKKVHTKKDDIWDLDSQLTMYTVVFDNGPMGLNLEEAKRYGIDGAVVKALKGQAQEVGTISVGDIVAKVNGEDVLSERFDVIMKTIREASVPRIIHFVPKEKLAEVQQVNSRQSEMIRPRESIATSRVAKKLVEDNKDDEKTITQLIMDNQSATIRKGRAFKQGRVLRNWKSRYFVLTVSNLEYFKTPSSTTPRGTLNFLNERCAVRALAPSDEIISKSPPIPATHLIEVCVGTRKLVMACTSSTDKKMWIDALKLAIDSSRTVHRRLHLNKSVNEAQSLRGERSVSADAIGLGEGGGGRLSQLDYDKFSTPILHINVISASSLCKRGSSVNAFVKITLGSEHFQTSTVKNTRQPVWKQDNTASFEVPDDELSLEVLILDEHTFRSNELISTLNIPIKSLPNMQKMIKRYPLVLSNGTTGSQLSLSLEYINKAKAFHDEQARERLNDDLSKAKVMNEREATLRIQTEAQAAVDEAQEAAEKATQQAKNMMEEAHRKAEEATLYANEKNMSNQELVEKLKQEAQIAKEEAARAKEEAAQAQEEAQALREANRSIQEGKTLTFEKYTNMLRSNESHSSIRQKMAEDGLPDTTIQAFFQGISSNSSRVQALEAEVKSLSTSRSENSNRQDLQQFRGMDANQEKLLRYLLKLEKQIRQAGLTIAEDIPYEEAKERVEKIITRMGEIGSSDVVHPDPEIQRSLREEYFRLEQDLEKYNTALMLSDEYAEEQRRKEEEWEATHKYDNLEALYAIRRMMPVEVKVLSQKQMMSMETPNKKRISLEHAKKYKRTNVLELIRTSPQEILRMHPSSLENLRITGLTLTERRALHMHLKDIALQWKQQESEEMAKRKNEWFKNMKKAFKTLLNTYTSHIEKYGPPEDHRIATRDNPNDGCQLLGKQCPVKADRQPAYNDDLGFPDGNVYAVMKVHKGEPDDAGAKALLEAQRMLREKQAGAMDEALKKHYKGKLKDRAEAKGFCDNMMQQIDTIELKQTIWIEERHKKSKNRQAEIGQFRDMLKSLRLTFLKCAERSGMKLSGKRDASKDSLDTRSYIEISLCTVLIEASTDMLRGIEERMKVLNPKDKEINSSINIIRQMMGDIKRRNTVASENFKKELNKRPLKKFKPLAEIVKEVMEKVNSKGEGGNSNEQNDETPRAAGGRSGRGRRGRGGPDLMSAIKGRGRGNDLMSAIKARGERGRGGDDGGGLMAAIKARGSARANPQGGLMAAIKARGQK